MIPAKPESLHLHRLAHVLSDLLCSRLLAVSRLHLARSSANRVGQMLDNLTVL